MTLVIAAEHISESCDSNNVFSRCRQRRKLHNALLTTGAADMSDGDGVAITLTATAAGEMRKELQTTAAEADKK
jgi:hypothetical protein